MHLSPAAPLDLARRVLLAQIIAGLVLGAAGAALGSLATGLASALGGMALALGTLAMARFSLGGGVRSGEAVMLRMVAGMLLKWMLVAAVLLLAAGVWRLPPLPMLVGVVGALIASALAAIGKH